MKDMEKKIKMELLEKLMSEMDDSIMSRFDKDDEEEPTVEVSEVEHKEMPLDEAKDFIKEKMGMSDDSEADESEENEEEEEEDYGGSELMARLKEMKKKKLQAKE